MSLAGLVSHMPPQGGLLSRNEAHLDDIGSAQPNVPGKGLGDGNAAIGFDCHDWAQGDDRYAASIYSDEELSNEDNSVSPSEGPGDGDIVMSDDPPTETFQSGSNQAISRIVSAEELVLVRPCPLGKSAFTAINAIERLTEAEVSSQKSTPSHPPAVVGASGAETHISISSDDQSVPDSISEVEEESEPEDTPREAPPSRVTSEERQAVDTGLWLVRKARQRKIPFQPPYSYRDFLSIARTQLYPINSVMPRETHPIDFHVAIMYRDDRVGRDRHDQPVTRTRYRCLSLSIHTEVEDPSQVFTPGQLQTLHRLANHPIQYFHDLNVVRIFDLLYLQDGKNTTRQTTMRLSHRLDPRNIGSDEQYGQILYNDRWLLDQFTIKIREILGADATAALIRMHRFPEEPLVWRHNMEPLTFITEIMWRIDHPIINVYPVDWRPVMSFEEAEEERVAAEAVAERAAAERAAAERAAAEQVQAGQLPNPLRNVTQDTGIEVPTTQNSGIQVPATQEPGIGDQVIQTTGVQVTQTTGTQAETSRPQGRAANPSATTGGHDPIVLGRLDLIDNTLRALVALNRRQAPTMPNFRCPQLAPTCGLEVPVEPRDTFATRVQQHLMGHVWGGGNFCSLDRYCHARLELMNNGQRTEHQLMHDLHRRRATGTGPRAPPPPPIPPLLPPVDILPKEPGPPPRSPSPPNASEESDVGGAPRKGANYCGVCGKFINNLTAADEQKKRDHLNKCNTKKRYMKTKAELDAEKQGGPSKDSPKKGGQKRKVDGEDDDDDRASQNEGGGAAGGDGPGGDAGTEGGNGGGSTSADPSVGRLTRHKSGAVPTTRRPTKRTRGGWWWPAKTQTTRPDDIKGKGKEVDADDGDNGDDGNDGNEGNDGNNGNDGDGEAL